MCVRVQFTRGTVQSQHLYFDRDNFFLLQCIKNTPYYAIFTPSFKSLVNAIPFAVFFWKCPPFAPVFGNIQDSVDKCAIVDFYIPTLNRKIQLTIKPAGGHESGTDDGTEMKGQKATGESDDKPDLPRKARHVPPMEIATPSNGLKKIS